MLCEGEKAPLPGQIFKNPNLANTFRKIAKEGAKGYYEGSVAEAIVEGMAHSLLNMWIFKTSAVNSAQIEGRADGAERSRRSQV